MALGLLIGTLTAYSGVGAGALLTPLLVLFGGVQADVAIGSDLLFALLTKVVALGAHVRKRTVDLSILLRLAPAGIVGALCGVFITRRLHVALTHGVLDHVLHVLLAGILFVSAVAIVAGMRLPRTGVSGDEPPLPSMALAAIGFVVGLVVSLTSIGAGSLTLPLLMLAMPAMGLRRLVGADIAFSVVLLVPSLAGRTGLGDVNVPLAGWLLCGSIPGVFLGAYVMRSLPEAPFRYGLAAILAVVALTLLR